MYTYLSSADGGLPLNIFHVIVRPLILGETVGVLIRGSGYLLGHLMALDDDHGAVNRPHVNEHKWRSAESLVHGDERIVCSRSPDFPSSVTEVSKTRV